ncbi:hypothetical protein V5E38_05745 [Rossellomorea sp. GAMAL-10_SWC]
MHILIYLLAALVIFAFAYMIWKKKMLFLLIGFNEKLFLGDKEKLAKRVGIITTIIGLGTFLLPIFTYIFGQNAISFYGVFVLLFVTLATFFYTIPYFYLK